MTDDHASRRVRVERVVAAGARVADPRDRLGQEARRRLPRTSGLSEEGVELALARHLEVAPSEGDLDLLISRCTPADRCFVVLAANVCTAPLRALAVAVATAPHVVVRPSRRDPVVAELLVRTLQVDPVVASSGGSVALAASSDRDSIFAAPAAELDLAHRGCTQAVLGDELHVYGTDETIAALCARAGSTLRVRGHGAGLGLAVVGEDADLEAAAQGIADDVVPFDQRGCLSPRFVLVEGDATRADGLAAALHAALDAAGALVPRGPLDDASRGDVAMYRATLQAVGKFWEGRSHGLGVDPAPRALVLPPAARVVHVVPCTARDMPALLAPWRDVVTVIGAVGEGPLVHAAWALASRARRSRLGQMQRPPLDGPVDLRVL